MRPRTAGPDAPISRALSRAARDHPPRIDPGHGAAHRGGSAHTAESERHRARREAPKKRRKGKKGARRPRRTKRQTLELAIPFLDLFREEFFVALGQALDWTDEDAQEFWRDLELYEKLTVREPRRRRMSTAPPASGPFVDRVGLLLDPSLMEQARRAAGKFQLELNSAADRVLRKVFSRRRTN